MGAVRRRFTPAERELLVPGMSVMVKNATTWRLAVVTTGEIMNDFDGQQYVWVNDVDRPTRSTSPGPRWAMPKGIRARSAD